MLVGALNAYTSREHTAYYARMLADDLPLATEMISDILQHSVFTSEELEKERHVILQEIGEVEDTPSDLIFDLFQSTAYPDQPIGRSILGPEEIVATLSRDALFDHMGKHYGPSRMLVSASGKVDHDEIVAMVERLFTDLPTVNEEVAEPAVYQGGESRMERDLEQVHICLGLDAFSYRDPDFYALQLFSTALGGGMSSRLFQELRENRGLCYSVFSFTGLHKDSGLFGIYAGTGADEAAELLSLMGDEIRKLAERIDEEELKRARAQLKASLMMSLESCFAVCEDMAKQHLCFGNRLSASEIVAKIEEVDREDIARVGQRLLNGADRPTLTAIGPLANLPSIDKTVQRLAA